MAKIVEFSAYKTKKKIVENLVNLDIGAKKFFEFFPEVRYVDDIETILKYCVKKQYTVPKIFATRIKLQNRYQPTNQGYHSIVTIWNQNENTLYFYDPNGAYNKQKTFMYKIGNKTWETSAKFQQEFDKLYKIKIKLSKWRGIQQVSKTQCYKTQYILCGGYCMFYNWLAIDFMLKNKDAYTLSEMYNLLTKPQFYKTIFPRGAPLQETIKGTATSKTLEGQTVEIINMIFKKN